MRYAILFVITSCLLLALVVGCSESGESPSVPLQEAAWSDGQSFAPQHYILNFNPDDWTVTLNEVDQPREALFDVTDWAEIQITDAEWIPSERNWYITAQLKNTTPLKGFGVWTVFTELGEKVIRDIDGFIYYGIESKRVPFIALNKDAPQREFPGYHIEEHTFVIHWPMEVNNWQPIEFYIDASWPKARVKPMVEDLQQANFTPPCYEYAIRAQVLDFQSTSEELTVWADLSSYGEGDHVVMYDDGEHEDLEENDGIFAAIFGPGSIFGTYTFTVYAQDPEGHGMENDLFFAPISFPPLPPIDWETIAKGQQSGIHEERFEIIEDDDSWTTFWDQHSSYIIPPPDKPEINFDQYMVGVVMLGEKPDSCYGVNVTKVNYSTINCGIMVDYDEIIPEDDCVCADVITYPHHFVKISKSWMEVGFKGTIEYLVCDCLEWDELQKGTHCQVFTKEEWLITDEPTLVDVYHQLFGPDTGIPNINFDEQVVIVMTQGSCPSTMYYIKVDDICQNQVGEYEIVYHRMIPGENCMVLWVMTSPYMIIVAEKNPDLPIFKGDDVVYPC